MTARWRGPAALVVRIGLGSLFAGAGALKFSDPAGFATAIANYQLFPALAPYLAATLPMLEMIVGVGVIVLPRSWRGGAALCLAALAALFGVATASALVRGVDVACGCFGGGGARVTGLTLVRDVGLLVAAAWLVLVDRRAANPGTLVT